MAHTVCHHARRTQATVAVQEVCMARDSPTFQLSASCLLDYETVLEAAQPFIILSTRMDDGRWMPVYKVRTRGRGV